MNKLVICTGLIFAGLAVCAVAAREANVPIQKGTMMTARGTFNVKVTPQPQDDVAGGPFGRLFLDKQFNGDLKGSSKGQMLASGQATDQSGAYVALELVTGTLNGKHGSFVLQHKGTMRNGLPTLDVTVVPGSGTGELSGISGAMTIRIEGREHLYEFEYTFGEP